MIGVRGSCTMSSYAASNQKGTPIGSDGILGTKPTGSSLIPSVRSSAMPVLTISNTVPGPRCVADRG